MKLFNLMLELMTWVSFEQKDLIRAEKEGMIAPQHLVDDYIGGVYDEDMYSLKDEIDRLFL